MESKYRDTMARSSDEQLQNIITQPQAYEPEAYIAAVEELERRGLGTPELETKKEEAYQRLREDEQQKATAKVGLLTLLKPTKEYFYTPIILYLNVAVWLLMVFSGVHPIEPSVEHLIAWGGNL